MFRPLVTSRISSFEILDVGGCSPTPVSYAYASEWSDRKRHIFKLSWAPAAGLLYTAEAKSAVSAISQMIQVAV